MNHIEIIEQLLKLRDNDTARSNMRFFKKTKDSYCAKDLFLGISAPKIKSFVKQINNAPQDNLEFYSNIITNEYNEIRIVGWLLLVKFATDDFVLKIVLEYAKYCGNWNVVDNAAPLITKKILKKLGTNGVCTIEKLGYNLFEKHDLWSVRFAIVLSLYLIKNNQLKYALDVCKKNLYRTEDMIRKPIGWMLREIGKKDKQLLIEFLEKNIHQISSISLSYSMEHFTKEEKTCFRKLRKKQN